MNLGDFLLTTGILTLASVNGTTALAVILALVLIVNRIWHYRTEVAR